MKDRVVIVTGAARGIGRESALHLARSGWTVVACDIAEEIPGLRYPLASPEMLSSLAEHDRIHPLKADVRSPKQLSAVVERALELGELCAAVACAGVVSGGKPAWLTDLETHRLTFDINYFGVLNLINVAMPAILAADAEHRRSFVAIASAAGHLPLETMSDYVASKHAVIGLIRTLALDLKGTGITANTVSPGSTDTPILTASAEIFRLSSAEEFATHHITQQLISASEIASMVGYLLSDQAASITGTDIRVDAGMLS